MPFPSPGDLRDQGMESMSLMSPALAGGFFTTTATWEALEKESQVVVKDTYTSQRHQEWIYNCKFSKVNTLRKGRAGAQSQEEICPKFIQGEEHGEFLLVSRD